MRAPAGPGSRRGAGRRQALALLAALTAVALALVGCTSDRPDATSDLDGPRAAIRVASFDFSESEVLAELYAAALQRRGFRVTRLPRLGSREVVQPALERGLIDVVPEYAGSALRFLTAADGPMSPAAASLPDRLRAALARRGVTPLRLASAQDRNGIVVTAAFAARHRLRRISDLRRVEATLIFGGPPECPQRPYCLPGLTSRYGLRFASFLPMRTRAITAEALVAGEISVGMLETTDGRLGGSELVLLADDRRLQPPENVVPVVRAAVLTRYGPPLAAALDAVSGALTTEALIELNRQVEVADQPAARVAADWVAARVPAG